MSICLPDRDAWTNEMDMNLGVTLLSKEGFQQPFTDSTASNGLQPWQPQLQYCGSEQTRTQGTQMIKH